MHDRSGAILRNSVPSCVAALALILGTALAQAQTSTWEAGIFIDSKNRMRGFTAASAAACRQACLADDRCGAWHYSFPTFPDPKYRSLCELFSGASSKKPAPAGLRPYVVAGVKQGGAPPVAAGRNSTWEAGVNIVGPLLGEMPMANAQACRDQCLRDTRCAAWRFSSLTNRCGTLSSVTAWPSSSYMTSGRIKGAAPPPAPPPAAAINGPAAYNAGWAAYQRKDYAAALEYLDRALQAGGLSPAYRGHAMAVRADSLTRLNRLPEARAAYDDYLRINPRDSIGFGNRGAVHMFERRYDAAIADFDTALRLNPRNARALVGRGTARYFRREYDAAIADLDAALRIEAQNTVALGYRGRAHAEKRDFTRAEADFAALARLEPSNVDAYIGRGMIARLQDNPTAAIAAYDEALRLSPNNTEALRGRGASHALAQNWDKAVVDVSALLRLMPADIPARRLRALLFRDGVKNLGMALVDYSEWIRVQPNDPDAYEQRAVTYERKRDYAAAITDWTKAIELAPNNVRYRYGRASAYQSLEAWDKALADYGAILQLAPNDVQARLDRSYVYHNGLKDFVRAVEELNEAIRFDPKRGLAYRNRATSHSALGKLPEAIADMTKALELEPKSVEWLRLRAEYYRNAGQYERALTDLTAALKLKSDDHVALAIRGQVNRYAGQVDFALEDLNAALRAKPDYAWAYYQRGWVFITRGDHARAEADFSSDMRLEPELTRSYSARGQARLYLGRPGEAATDLTAARGRAPKNVYYVLWLHIAERRAAKAEAAENFARYAGELDLAKWPAPAVSLYLGRARPEDVLAAARDPDARTERGRLCEAHFYVAEHYLVKGDKEKAIEHFRAAIATGESSFIEYEGARAELRRLGASER